MRQVNKVTLRLTPLQFQVIYEFLVNVKLGDNNKWESAISDLMGDLDVDLDSVTTETSLISFLESQNGCPNIMAHASTEDGLVFSIN